MVMMAQIWGPGSRTINLPITTCKRNRLTPSLTLKLQ